MKISLPTPISTATHTHNPAGFCNPCFSLMLTFLEARRLGAHLSYPVYTSCRQPAPVPPLSPPALEVLLSSPPSLCPRCFQPLPHNAARRAAKPWPLDRTPPPPPPSPIKQGAWAPSSHGNVAMPLGPSDHGLALSSVSRLSSSLVGLRVQDAASGSYAASLSLDAK